MIDQSVCVCECVCVCVCVCVRERERGREKRLKDHTLKYGYLFSEMKTSEFSSSFFSGILGFSAVNMYFL